MSIYETGWNPPTLPPLSELPFTKYALYDPGNRLFYEPFSGFWKKSPGHLYDSRPIAQRCLNLLAKRKTAGRTIEIVEVTITAKTQ